MLIGETSSWVLCWALLWVGGVDLRRRFMGRYQVGDEETHPGKKTHPKISTGEDNGVDNGKILNENRSVGLKEKGMVSMSGVTTKGGSSTNDRVHHHGGSDPLNEGQENQPLKSRMPGGDLLSQWRQKKRSRGCRTAVDDSARKSSPIEMHSARTARQTMSAQAHSINIALPRPCIPVGSKRNSEDLPSSASNGVHRHSPASSEKSDKMPPCIPFDNGALADCAAPNLATPPETQALAPPADKMNLDLLEWPRIYISLSRKEKEDDFFVIKGSKLPQRPKRRPKIVEKNLQNCYPGIWLSDLARGRYEVREKKCTRKKPRGLKAMESLESDSD